MNKNMIIYTSKRKTQIPNLINLLNIDNKI